MSTRRCLVAKDSVFRTLPTEVLAEAVQLAVAQWSTCGQGSWQFKTASFFGKNTSCTMALDELWPIMIGVCSKQDSLQAHFY